MKKYKSINLKVVISILFIVNIIFIGKVCATQKMLIVSEAKSERIKISRYLLANENKTVKNKYPNWAILTSKEITELDKNGDNKIDKTDLVKVKRHILAAENSNIKKKYPDWIIYENKEILSEKITLNKTSLTIDNKKSEKLNATITPSNVTDKMVTWSSSNTSVVTVDSVGKITAQKAGTATITVKTKNGKTASCKVTVEEIVTGIKLDKTAITIENKKTVNLVATITPTNATNKTLTWSSSNTSVATVEKNGKVTAKKAGTTIITVKSSNGKTATCKVTVEEPVTSIKINKTTLALDNKKTEILKTTITPTNATNKTVTWSSSNTTVATVDKNGKVTAKKAGIATITVKTSNGKIANCKVTVEEPVTSIKIDKTTLSLDNKKTETLKTTITPTNATNKTVTWSSSNSTVATVDKNGKVTAKKAGTTTITVKTANGKTASCLVKVNQQDNKVYKILLIGNSYIFNNDLGGMLAEFGKTTGHNMVVVCATHGSWTSEEIAKGKIAGYYWDTRGSKTKEYGSYSNFNTTLSQILDKDWANLNRKGSWDYIILQNSWTIEAGFNKIYSMAKNKIPSSKNFIALGTHWVNGTGESQAKTYAKLANQNKTSVIVTGVLFGKVNSDWKKYFTIRDESGHPSARAQYFNACAIYAKIFGKNELATSTNSTKFIKLYNKTNGKATEFYTKLYAPTKNAVSDAQSVDIDTAKKIQSVIYQNYDKYICYVN